MDFQKEVLEASSTQPIVVDFWAEWCGPCQFLGPILENMESEQSKWKLVKVNVDENPEISQKYGIRGIPDVRLFVNGEVVGQFTGSKPQHEIQKWLEDFIPDERIEILNKLVQEGKTDQLEKFVKDNPDLEVGKVALSQMVIWENPDLANELMEGIKPGNALFDKTEHLITIIEFLKHDLDGGSNVEEHLTAAKVMKEKDFDSALHHIIQAVMIDKTFQKDLPRKLAIALFNILGPDHELTKKYRKRFDMALY